MQRTFEHLLVGFHLGQSLDDLESSSHRFPFRFMRPKGLDVLHMFDPVVPKVFKISAGASYHYHDYCIPKFYVCVYIYIFIYPLGN